MVKASNAQIRKIHILAREQGLDTDTLHSMVYKTVSKEHISQLAIAEAVKVIDSLSGKKIKKDSNPAEVASMRQINYIKGMMQQLGWVTEAGEPDLKRLNGLLSKCFKLDSFKWLTKEKASDVIEALKSMLERHKENVYGSKEKV